MRPGGGKKTDESNFIGEAFKDGGIIRARVALFGACAIETVFEAIEVSDRGTAATGRGGRRHGGYPFGGDKK